jgi:hypothetical protein
MAPKESEICKQSTAGITRHITFTIPETLEIIMKPENVTSRSVIMAAYKIEFLTIYGIRNTRKKVTCKKLHQ